MFWREPLIYRALNGHIGDKPSSTVLKGEAGECLEGDVRHNRIHQEGTAQPILRQLKSRELSSTQQTLPLQEMNSDLRDNTEIHTPEDRTSQLSPVYYHTEPWRFSWCPLCANPRHEQYGRERHSHIIATNTVR